MVLAFYAAGLLTIPIVGLETFWTALRGAVDTCQACPPGWPISYIIFTTLHNTSENGNVVR